MLTNRLHNLTSTRRSEDRQRTAISGQSRQTYTRPHASLQLQIITQGGYLAYRAYLAFVSVLHRRMSCRSS